MDVINAKSNTYPFVEVVIYSEILRTNCRVNQSRFSRQSCREKDEGNELTRDDFGNGYTFFGFDLTPDACDGGCLHLVQKGNLRIEIHFAEALAQTVNVIVYAEFEAVLEIDKGRNIIYNHP